MNGSELGRESGVDGPNAAQLNLIDQSLTPFLARPMNKQVTAEGSDPHFRETLAPLYNFPIVLLRAPSPQPRRRRRYNRAPRFLSRRRDGTPPLFFLPLSLRQRIVPPVDFVCARMMRSYGSLS